MFFIKNRRHLRELRKAGDVARDARNWAEASTQYGAYLSKASKDVGIHVQYGHVLKEAGRVEEAEKAYARALALSPHDPDLLLNYARLLKQQTRFAEARKMLGLSIARGYTRAAFDELRDIADERIQWSKTPSSDISTEKLAASFVGLTPTRTMDVDFIPQSNRLKLLGGDPWITLELDQELVTGAKAGIIHFSITNMAKEGDAPQTSVYLDYGNGMSEELCCLPAIRDDGYSVLIVRPNMLKALRWDPNDRESEFILEKVEFKPIRDRKEFDEAISETASEFYILPDEENFAIPVLSEAEITANAAEKLQMMTPSNFSSAFNYNLWVKLYDSPSDTDKQAMAVIHEKLKLKPSFSFVMPVYNPPPALLAKCIDSLLAQNYANFEICIADDASTDLSVRRLLSAYARKETRIKFLQRELNGHISAASNDALALASGDYVALVDHDDLVAPHALLTIARYINAYPQAEILFSDEDKIDIDGNRSNPYFKTCYNQFLMYGHNMVTHLGVYRRTLVEALGGFREGLEGSQDYDLMLRCAERVSREQIVHVPHVLYHWRMIPGSTAVGADQKGYAIHAARLAINGHFERTERPFVSVANQIPGTSAIAQTRRYQTSISIIIPTRNGLEILEPCIRSILANPCENVEIIIIDNGSDDPDALRYLADIDKHEKVRVISYPVEFNYSLINNFGVDCANGDIICLLNNDTEVMSSNWLQRARLLLSDAQVGIVGAKLYYPNMTIQHFGTVLGMGRDAVAGHIGLGTPRGSPGHFNRSGLLAEFSAVTAACLFMRKGIFEQVGGLDPTLKVAFNDVDLCLKVRAAGYLVVADPEIELIHKESMTRGSDQVGEKRDRFLNEVRQMHQKWGDTLLNDPYYSPNHSSLTLDFALAYPPRVARPWSDDSTPQRGEGL